jgi:hypothetical protein
MIKSQFARTQAKIGSLQSALILGIIAIFAEPILSLSFSQDQCAYIRWCPAAQAKIGDSIGAFRVKFARIFSLTDTSNKDGKTYYRFTLNNDPIQQKSSAGFSGGMTITCSNGKIQGESLIVRLGKNTDMGKVFTVGLCLDITYEAIGKPIVTDKKEAGTEFRSYLNAVNQALTGTPQDIKYAGYNSRITMSHTGSGDILLAIAPLPVSVSPPKGKK